MHKNSMVDIIAESKEHSSVGIPVFNQPWCVFCISHGWGFDFITINIGPGVTQHNSNCGGPELPVIVALKFGYSKCSFLKYGVGCQSRHHQQSSSMWLSELFMQ